MQEFLKRKLSVVQPESDCLVRCLPALFLKTPVKVMGVSVSEVNSFRYGIYLVSYLTSLPQDVRLQAEAITLCPTTTAHRRVIDLSFKAAAYMHGDCCPLHTHALHSFIFQGIFPDLLFLLVSFKF